MRVETQFSIVSIPFQDRLDAEHREALELIPEDLLNLSTLEKTRKLTEQLMTAAAARQPAVGGIRVEDCKLPAQATRPELLLRLYIPIAIAHPAPVLLYIHGGGFVLGEVWHFDAQCKQLAAGADCIVASIEYRRAPEHPYPIPMEDSYAALAWLHAVAEERGLDVRRIGVGGSSAGAGLAAGLALLARDRGKYPIAFQFLEAPMLDHRCITPSSQSIEHPRVWNRAANEAAWAAYLGADHLHRNIPVYASPAIAMDLARLPPAYLCIGAHDLFLDETFDYAQRLLRAGVAVQFHVYEMGFHGSPRGLPSAPVSQRWRADSVSALKRLASTATV